MAGDYAATQVKAYWRFMSDLAEVNQQTPPDGVALALLRDEFETLARHALSPSLRGLCLKAAAGIVISETADLARA